MELITTRGREFFPDFNSRIKRRSSCQKIPFIFKSDASKTTQRTSIMTSELQQFVSMNTAVVTYYYKMTFEKANEFEVVTKSGMKKSVAWISFMLKNGLN